MYVLQPLEIELIEIFYNTAVATAEKPALQSSTS